MRNFSRISNVEIISTHVKHSLAISPVAYNIQEPDNTAAKRWPHAAGGSNMKPRPRTVTIR